MLFKEEEKSVHRRLKALESKIKELERVGTIIVLLKERHSVVEETQKILADIQQSIREDLDEVVEQVNKNKEGIQCIMNSGCVGV